MHNEYNTMNTMKRTIQKGVVLFCVLAGFPLHAAVSTSDVAPMSGTFRHPYGRVESGWAHSYHYRPSITEPGAGGGSGTGGGVGGIYSAGFPTY
jgi:hypothetical protein